VAQEARQAGVKWLVGDFLPTKKNTPAKDVYQQHGFKETEQNSDILRYELDIENAGLNFPEWFEVVPISAKNV